MWNALDEKRRRKAKSAWKRLKKKRKSEQVTETRQVIDSNEGEQFFCVAVRKAENSGKVVFAKSRLSQSI